MKSSIRSSFSLLVLLSAAGFVISFASQCIISYHFGNSLDLDAYWAAFAMTNILIFFMPPVRDALAPELHRRLSVDKKAASEYLSQVITGLLIITGIVSILTFFYSDWLVSFVVSSSQPEMRARAALYLQLFTPALSLLILFDIFTAALTCYDKVVLYSISRLIGSMALLLIIFCLAGKLGVAALPIAFIGAHLLTVVIQAAVLFRQGFRFRLIWFKDADRRFFIVSGILMAAAIMTQIYAAIEKQTFSSFGAGIVSSFQYAVLLTNVAVTLTGCALASAFWPKFLDQVSANNRGELLGSVFRALHVLMLILGWISVLCFINARPIIQLLFGRGAFGPDAVALTAYALQITIFASAPMSGIILIGRALVSFNSIRSMAIVSFATTAMGLLILFAGKMTGSLNLSMMHWLAGNIAGCVASIWLIYSICRGARRDLRNFILWCARLFAALGAAAVLSNYCAAFLSGTGLFMELISGSLIFTALFGVFVYLLRINVVFSEILAAARKEGLRLFSKYLFKTG
jgi:putative peptidoglycan lipid II flippase